MVFGQGEDGPFLSEEDARKWVRKIDKKGAKGIKFFGAPANIMRAALDEAGKTGLGKDGGLREALGSPAEHLL